jgi:putative NIF3 family GTP cyclohydrolase 1 type 2
MSMTVAALLAALDERVPFATAETWDNVGLVCGDPAQLIEGCCVALNPTPAAIDYTARAGANLLVTHHPPFLTPPSKIVPLSALQASYEGAVVFAALTRGVALIALHTNLDRAPCAQGAFAAALGLSYVGPFQELGDGRAYGQRACMRTDRNTVAELAAWTEQACGIAARVWGNPYQRVEEVVILNGSANGFVEQLVEREVTCAIVGEIDYHRAQALAARGVALIELGHDVSELPLLTVLQSLLSDSGVAGDIITTVGPREYWWQPTERFSDADC